MRVVLLFLLSISLLYATPIPVREYSPLPLPKLYVIDYEAKQCDSTCLDQLYDEGKLFSFIASYDPENASIENGNRYRKLATLLNLDVASMYIDEGQKFKIALMLPKKIIGKYAISTSHSMLAYLLLRNQKFKFKVIDTVDEKKENIEQGLKVASEEGYEYIIALFTKNGADAIASIDEHSNFNIYIPSVNKGDVVTASDTIIYGGIDYKTQVQKLMAFAGEDKPTVSIESGRLGREITNMLEADMLLSGNIDFNTKDSATLKNGLQRYRNSIAHDSLFLNTPAVKSALVLSQVTFHQINPRHILSTQLNYWPLIFSLTQAVDRKKLVIANSITSDSPTLIEANRLLQSDTKYDWVSYSTSYGIDYFFSKIYPNDENQIFTESILDNAVQYDTELVKTDDGAFVRIR